MAKLHGHKINYNNAAAFPYLQISLLKLHWLSYNFNCTCKYEIYGKKKYCSTFQVSISPHSETFTIIGHNQE